MKTDRPHWKPWLASWLLILSLAGCATVAPSGANTRPFDFAKDTFAFRNDTVWSYRDGSRVTDPAAANNQKVDRYTRRCFVMAAAVVQFWKFARFEPTEPPLPPAELARRIRQVRDIATWAPTLAATQRITFPGYACFRDLSAREGHALRANLGPVWTTYFQFRKYSMPFVPSRAHQARTNAELQEWLRLGQPMVLWLYNFPNVNINHAVTVFAVAPVPDSGQCAYLVYDPNYTDAPHTLVYNPAQQAFSYEKTFYFVGGAVHVRPMYLGLFN